MSTSLWSLLGFTAWTLLLVLGLVLYRSAMVLGGRRRANAWGRNQPSQDPEFFQRLAHAHANCLENLPLFAAVILIAGLTDKWELTDPLSGAYLAFRICQSTVHLTGTSPWQVVIRVSFFLPQLLLLGWMMGRLAGVL
ncbi:MAPEG family protein [Stigmatella sp. ncwal1]|uniref:MAPEG family protein n=1 Tax=Stigmatella ashevillensis TaxID=2995309 RepID=A0ABT5DLH5_9BACT|nr:MAPEG family protein [Stigmatella ashevillena]MDC0713990.1 MAPEG family protein [Stigmatella ashevillena]